ncbi:MAG: hypothetical protein KKG33_05775 [candidate division Zixibacteria bacterium]|nr:hypothetical protein [candidate division Zixibacteria bacterium]MBU1471015.1 hypothetical protein [candidate division Zixibacteria bacterium]MBU2625050.1 hypothetical protein [candidate division Zixibacteria bacterium]
MKDESTVRECSILVIDSEPEFAEDLSVLLPSEYDVEIAGGLGAAIRSIRDHRPDCVLLDAQTPLEKDGVRCFEGMDQITLLREKCTDMDIQCPPLISMSARLADVEDAPLEARPEAQIGKPLDIDELKKIIKRLTTF